VPVSSVTNATNITMPDGTKIFAGTDEPPK